MSNKFGFRPFVLKPTRLPERRDSVVESTPSRVELPGEPLSTVENAEGDVPDSPGCIDLSDPKDSQDLIDACKLLFARTPLEVEYQRVKTAQLASGVRRLMLRTPTVIHLRSLEVDSLIKRADALTLPQDMSDLLVILGDLCGIFNCI